MKKFLSVLLAVMMVLSTASFAAPALVGTQDTAVEEIPAVEVPAVEEAELTADVPTNVADYGTLLWNIDFEDSTYPIDGAISECGPITSYISAANEKPLPAEFTGFYRIQAPKPGADYIGSYNTSMNGTNAYVVNGAGSGTRYPYFGVSGYVSNSNWTGVAFPNGYYTFVADVAKGSSNTTGKSFLSRISNEGGKTTGETHTLTNEMDTYVHFITIEDGTNSGQKVSSITGGTVHDDLGTVSGIGSYFGTSELTDIYYIDNYRVYWKPLTVDVTVKALGKETTVNVSTNGVPALDLVTAAGLPYEYNAKTVTVGDRVYGASDKIYFTEDTTAVIEAEKIDSKWFNDEYGYAIFDLTFENETAGASATNSRNNRLEKYFSPVADKFLARPKSEWGFSINNGGTFVSDPTGAGKGMVGQGNASTGYPALMVENTLDKLERECWVDNDNLVLTLVYDFYSEGSAVATTERFGGRTDLLSWNNGQFSQSAPYNADAEDTCNEVSDKTVTNQANTWRTVVSTFTSANLKNLTSTNQVSFIKAHAAAPSGAHYYDNVKVFFKYADADVTINANGLKGVTGGSATNVATSGLTAQQILDKAGVNISGLDPMEYKVLGISQDEKGEGKVFGLNETVNFAVDTTFYLIWEEVDMSEWLDADKGMLLFDIDFNDAKAASVFTATTSNKDFALTSFAKVNPYIAGYESWKLTNSGMDIVGIENGALKLQWDGTGKWPQVLIGNPDNKVENVFFNEYGTYYVHAEYKIIDAVDADLASIAIQSNGVKDGVHSGPSGILGLGNDFYASRGALVANEWLVIDGGKSSKTIDSDGVENDDINKITTVFTYNNTSTSAGGYYLMDNVKLWWKPEKIDVTIEGGKNENFEAVTFKDISTATTAAELLAKMPVTVDDYGRLTGFADENGNKITGLSQFAMDATLQPIWTPWVIVDGSQEFATDKKGGWNQAGLYEISLGYEPDIGNGGGDLTTASLWLYNNGLETKNGNLYRNHRTPKKGDEKNGTLSAPMGWSLPATRSVGNAVMRDTVHTSLAAGNDAEYVIIKYKFSNIPDLAEVVANCDNDAAYKYTLSADGESINYFDRNGAAASASIRPEYVAKYYVRMPNGSYAYGGGEAFHKNEKLVEDVWYYDLLPVTEAMKTNGADRVLVQRAVMFDGMVTEYDYVRFVKAGAEDEPIKPELPEEPAPEYAPESSEDTSYRISAPNGIRFKADMTTEIDAKATDYGWVVGRAVRGATEETLVIGAANTITAYGRQDGVKIKDFFEETDELKTFTAVVYNIPAGNEDDVLCIKPFVKVDGEVYYGAMISKSPREVADAHGIDVSLLMKAGN